MDYILSRSSNISNELKTEYTISKKIKLVGTDTKDVIIDPEPSCYYIKEPVSFTVTSVNTNSLPNENIAVSIQVESNVSITLDKNGNTYTLNNESQIQPGSYPLFIMDNREEDNQESRIIKQLSFTITDSKNFRVAAVCAGNGDLRRQTILNKKLVLNPEKMGIKFYVELENLLAGRVDWNVFVNRLLKSMADEVMVRVHQALTNGYNQLGAKYKIKGTYEEDKLIDLVSRVKAKCGGEVKIYGTLKALGKISNIEKTGEIGKNDMYHKGYVGKFFSTDVEELVQVIDGEDEFVLKDDLILVVPVDGESIVKVGIEGTPVIIEAKDGDRTDLSEEYTMIQGIAVAAVVADNFGAYELS